MRDEASNTHTFLEPPSLSKALLRHGGETSVAMTIGEIKVAESVASLFTDFLNVLAVKGESQGAFWDLYDLGQ